MIGVQEHTSVKNGWSLLLGLCLQRKVYGKNNGKRDNLIGLIGYFKFIAVAAGKPALAFNDALGSEEGKLLFDFSDLFAIF